MRRRGFRAALRNYGSMRLLRQNSLAFTGLMFLALIFCFLPGAARVVHRGGVAALFAPHAATLTPFWMASFFLPGMLIHHYWRQVRSNLATTVPGLIAAEYAAVLVALVPAMLVLTAPLLWLGTPVLGTLALVAVGMATGGGFGGSLPTGQSTAVRRLRGLLFMPIILAGLAPHMIQRLVMAPWPWALAALLVAGAVVVLSLQYRPAAAAVEQDQQDTRADQLVRRAPPASGAVARVLAVLAWRPGKEGRAPDLPAAGILGLGPVGAVLLTVVQVLVMLVLFPLIGVISGQTLHQALAEQAPSALAVGAAIGLTPRTQWLLNRGEWPFLLVAGRFGSRAGFAQAVFRSQFRAVLLLSVATALVVAPLAWWLGLVRPAAVVPVALAITGLLFGGSYMPSLPLLWGEFGGKGLVVAAGMAGYLAVMFDVSLGLLHKGGLSYGLAGAAVLAVFGMLMARVAPGKLAQIDWPIEDNQTA